MSSFDRASRLRRTQRARQCWLAGMVATLAALVAPSVPAQEAGGQEAAAAAPNSRAAVPAPSGGPESPARAPLAPDPAFARYPQYRGTLGERRIVMRIGVKPDDPEGLNGEIAWLADTANGDARPARVVLIAGARDGDTLTLEESDDGVRISGQWVGVIAADGSVSGERMNNDESVSIPFDLRPAARAPGADGGRAIESQSGQERARPATSQGWP